MIERDCPDDWKRVLIAVYDVDARPNEMTLTALMAFMSANRPWPEVVQQLSTYFPTSGRVARFTIWGAMGALWQTRFTLAIERTMIERSGRSSPRCLLWSIANGFFIRLDTWKRIGFFTEKFQTEDIELGYRLSAAGVPIELLNPPLETGNPCDFITDVKQKSRWFSGLFDYLRYPGSCGFGSPLSRLFLAFQGLLRGVLWISSGPVLAVSILAPFLFGISSVTLLLSISAYLLPVVLMYITMLALADFASSERTKSALVRPSVALAIPFLAPLYAVNYCFGPFLYLAKFVFSRTRYPRERWTNA
ncbi:glycosyltransferase family 2 protein [Phyllobacterium leguminum]|nr:glycosyltransferase family 2 protein [Phyllobacterium leguminum]